MKQNGIIGMFLVFAMIALSVFKPIEANACGGFFCSTQPVDQRAERIIFAVNDTTITAYVQISYEGDPQDFSWILPIPSLTESLDVFPQTGITALDLATGPVFIYPDNPCVEEMEDTDSEPETADSSGDDGVTVHQREEVGPFEVVVISSEDSDALIVWLEENHYRITESMKPVIKVYVEAKMYFMAMKLQPDQGVADITPIVIEYRSEKPMIPLRLTAVAAEPEMSFVVWVLDQNRHEPENYATITIEPGDLIYDPRTGQHNYFQTVSRKVDEAGGRAFLTEFADSTEGVIQTIQDTFIPEEQQEAYEKLIALLSDYPYITRFYTRMSPEEMTLDPTFKSNAALPDVSNVYTLSLPEDYTCEDEGSADDLDQANQWCAFTYCGQGSCVLTEDGPGCECASHFVGRGFLDPLGRLSVTCQDSSLNFMSAEEMENAGGAFSNPCDGFSCGEGGTCVALNGVATCQCQNGYATFALFNDQFNPSVACSNILARQTTTEPSEVGCGCVLSNDQTPFTAQNLLFLGILILAGTRLCLRRNL